MNTASGARHSASFALRLVKKAGAVQIPDLVFHAPALEVLETPPSPVRTALLVAICALVVIALVAAFVCHINIYAQAPGRVESVGRSKVIQPLESGRVQRLTVQNGAHVAKGELLLELDPTDATAARNEASAQVQEYEAEVVRRHAAIAAAHGAGIPQISFTADIEPAVRQRQQSVLRADLLALRSGLDVLEANLKKDLAQKASLEAVLEAQKAVIQALEARLDMRRSLERDKWESQANVIDAEEGLAREVSAQVDREGQLRAAEKEIELLGRQKEETISKFVDENNQAAASIAAKLALTEQELIKSAAKAERTQLRAPIAGTVQELAVTTLGQVVSSGQQLMTLVPDQTPIQIEALVSSDDIGFVAAGQSAVIKVDTFPFTIYGTLAGHVMSVSRDAVDANSSQEALPTADSAAAPIRSGKSAAARTPNTRNVVFPIVVALDNGIITVDGRAVTLSPGMTVSVEVATGERRAIDYLLSPLRDVASRAIRER